MKDRIRCDVAAVQGHLQGVGDEAGPHVRGQLPAQHHAGGEVDHGGQVQPALTSSEVGGGTSRPSGRGNVADEPLARGAAGGEVTREQVSGWLKQDDKPGFLEMTDTQLAIFLNGLIVKNRGKKEGASFEPEAVLNNNIIFRKLRIALEFNDVDVIEVMKLAGFPIGKQELSALFRNPDHKNFRKCQDQMLRNFLKGLQLKFRPMTPDAEL